jgi:hypothetical protein
MKVPMQAFLDSVSIIGVFLAFAIASLVVYEIGYRIGRWWQRRTPEEVEGPTGMLVGSLLALMAFMLAISMGMASDRFDARRSMVLLEANAVGTTYLRAGYLPEPAASRSRELIREYVPLRIAKAKIDGLAVAIARSNEIQAELWTMAEDLARVTPDSDVLAIYIETLNDMIDASSSRIVAGIYARVPETVLALLIIGSVLTLGMVGYGAGLTRRRSPLTAVVLIVVLGAVTTLVVDLDRPRDGFLEVNQQPMIDLQQQVGPPSD